MLRLAFEDFLQNNRLSYGLALDNFRLDHSVEMGLYPLLLPTLTINEISQVLNFEAAINDFDALHPEYRVRDTANLRVADALHQNFKLEIFRNQFPASVEDVVHSFGLAVAEISDRFHGRNQDLLKLLRGLRSAELFNDHGHALVSMREPALTLALFFHDEGEDYCARELMQMVSASIYISDPEKCRPQIRNIANDNNGAVVQVLR